MYLVYYAPARVTSCCLVTQSKLAGLIQRNVVSVTSIYYYSPIIKCRVCTSSDCYECNKARVTLHLNLIVFHLADYYRSVLSLYKVVPISFSIPCPWRVAISNAKLFLPRPVWCSATRL